jgi:hypothetical protein
MDLDKPLDLDAVGTFAAFVFPGLVSLVVFRLLLPARSLEWKDSLVQALFYSIINYAVLFPVVLFVIRPANIGAHPLTYWLALVALWVIGPATWPVLWKNLFRLRLVRRLLQSPYPTAWDYFFDQREPLFVLISLNDGTYVGGYYDENSFASAFPAEGDIYVSAAYKVDADGNFLDAVPGSRGLLVRKDQYSLIQLFSVAEPGDDTTEGSDG